MYINSLYDIPLEFLWCNIICCALSFVTAAVF